MLDMNSRVYYKTKDEGILLNCSFTKDKYIGFYWLPRTKGDRLPGNFNKIFCVCQTLKLVTGMELILVSIFSSSVEKFSIAEINSSRGS